MKVRRRIGDRSPRLHAGFADDRGCCGGGKEFQESAGGVDWGGGLVHGG
jgi:hypothetical protein